MCLGQRFERLSDLKDMEAALQYDQEAVDLTPKDHPDRAGYLQSLAVSFREQFSRLGDLRDLETALRYDQEAVDLTPDDHPQRGQRLQSLGVDFGEQFRRLEHLVDLDSAFQNYKRALDLTPRGHPNRAGCLQNLAVSLNNQFQRFGTLTDLEAALQYSQEAVELTPNDHPKRAGYLQHLALTFSHRFQRLGNFKDLEAAQIHYSASFIISAEIPRHSWSAALQWASFSKPHSPSYCLAAYSAAFDLLPEIMWIGHSVSVRQAINNRMEIGQATSDAISACIELGTLTMAIMFVEQALATTFQQMLQLKIRVDSLPRELAQEFDHLSSLLYRGESAIPMRVVAERNNLINTIRTQHGLDHFLLSKEYKEICQAAQNGPIVILNSHKKHCDAIVILNPISNPLHIALPEVTLAQLEQNKNLLKDVLRRCNSRARESDSSRLFGGQEAFTSKPVNECFEEMLTWLWTNVVKHVFDALESYGIHGGRLWWCPVGAFTGLPLHAAAPSDQFIPSYTSTLGALLESNSKQAPTASRKLGLVGATHTLSGTVSALPGVEREISTINHIVGNTHEIHNLISKQATVEAVKAQLDSCSWIHLACHGIQDLQDPLKSRLHLYDGSLDLETILKMPLPNAEFVFLAACQTAMGDSELVNESFHLAGGLIAAGFRAAIGTMWSMQDADGPVVAEIIYNYLFAHGKQAEATDTAKALQLAVRKLRNDGVPHERWVPFIHMGV